MIFFNPRTVYQIENLQQLVLILVPMISALNKTPPTQRTRAFRRSLSVQAGLDNYFMQSIL